MSQVCVVLDGVDVALADFNSKFLPRVTAVSRSSPRNLRACKIERRMQPAEGSGANSR